MTVSHLRLELNKLDQAMQRKRNELMEQNKNKKRKRIHQIEVLCLHDSMFHGTQFVYCVCSTGYGYSMVLNDGSCQPTPNRPSCDDSDP